MNNVVVDENNIVVKKPYPNKCYLPFILYPPGMHINKEGDSFLERNIDMNQPGVDFVLYISIPFCRIRCKSCPYFVSALSEEDKHGNEDRYVDALVKDLINWSKFRKWNEGTIKDIYIGGGTGSILKVKNLKRVVDTIYTYYNIDPKACFTLEGNARDYNDPEKVKYIISSPINRISLGVQSFQPELLNIIGSPHAADDSIRAIKALQAGGMENIQIDLMYNLPGHSLEIWQKDLKVLSELGIPHFTIYLYRVHDETAQSKLIKKGLVPKPQDPETPMVKAMYTEAKRIAEDMGFHMYMVDHFCKPGYENMYNHWNWKVYIDTLAVGPGSYSYFDGFRLGTENNVDKYVEHVERGEFLISTVTTKMSDRVQRERYIIFALLYYSIEYDFYFQKFGTNLLDDFQEEIERLKNKGLIVLTDKAMELTSLGIVWHTNVILEFFNPLFWSDTNSLDEPNWSLNNVMVAVGAHDRSYWLGEKDQLFFE